MEVRVRKNSTASNFFETNFRHFSQLNNLSILYCKENLLELKHVKGFKQIDKIWIYNLRERENRTSPKGVLIPTQFIILL